MSEQTKDYANVKMTNGKGRVLQVITGVLLVLTMLVALYSAWIRSTPLSVYEEVFSASRIGWMVGSLCLVLVVIYLVWRFVCKQVTGRGMLIFSVIFLLLATVILAGVRTDMQYKKTLINDLQSLQRRLVNGDMAEYQINDQKRYGKYATIMNYFIGFMEQQKQTADQNSRLEKTLLSSIFTQEGLASVETVALGQQKLAELDQLYDRYAATFVERGEEYQAFVQELEIPRSLRSFFNSFHQGVENGVAGTLQLIRFEKETTAASRTFLEFLKTRIGQFELINSEFIFQNADGQQVFRDYAMELYRIQRAQMEMLESMRPGAAE